MLIQNAIFSSFVILLRSTVSNRNEINLKNEIQLRMLYNNIKQRTKQFHPPMSILLPVTHL
jgi:hypothetical protein